MNRTATRDAELRGQKIREGDKLLLLYPSGNRDERVFARSRPLRRRRASPNDHVAFGGYGAHFCLGSSLARLELRVMFEELLARLPDLELATREPLPLRPSNFIVGIEQMPVRFDAEEELMPDLSGKVAFVTAGATGIGFGCAQAIVASGGKVMICARREDTLREAVEKLGAERRLGRLRRDRRQVRRRRGRRHREALRRAPPGRELRGHRHGRAARCSTKTAEFERVLATNLTGAFRCVRAEARAMIAAGGGSIVNVSSIAGALTHPWMSRLLRVEGRPRHAHALRGRRARRAERSA